MFLSPSFVPSSHVPNAAAVACREQEILNTLPLPWTTAGVQLGIGVLFVVPVWLFGVRIDFLAAHTS